MNVETERFVKEGRKLAAETRKLDRDAPYAALFTAFTAGAAVVGAIAVLLKRLGA